ncbi:hypothetical protein BD410DRAFT_747310, partial [Rickenella mellea]
MDVDDEGQNTLDSVEGEIYFFRALMRSRPVGIHRHFHALSMQHAIEKGTGQQVPIDDIWTKLGSCYDLEALEALEVEYDITGSPTNGSTPPSVPSPSPSQNLAAHPFFKKEFTLPSEAEFDSLISARRMRATPSPPSTPPSAPAKSPTRRGRRRAVSKVDLAGLVSGDSDSSALTMESGDEAEQSPGTERRGSVATGTDGGTEEFGDEEAGED